MKKSTAAPARTQSDTRQKIMDAAVATLREEGIVGTTASMIF
jgi:AcrR family transcriptional regulator